MNDITLAYRLKTIDCFLSCIQWEGRAREQPAPCDSSCTWSPWRPRKHHHPVTTIVDDEDDDALPTVFLDIAVIDEHPLICIPSIYINNEVKSQCVRRCELRIHPRLGFRSLVSVSLPFLAINCHGGAHGHHFIRQEMAPQRKLLLQGANERLKHQNRRYTCFHAVTVLALGLQGSQFGGGVLERFGWCVQRQIVFRLRHVYILCVCPWLGA